MGDHHWQQVFRLPGKGCKLKHRQQAVCINTVTVKNMQRVTRVTQGGANPNVS
jgi:hypothetical protein